MRRALTELDREIWEFLWGRFELGNGSPSVQEMARACYCSHPKVLATITKLEAMGYVTWAWLDDRRAARGCLTVVAPSDEAVRRTQLHEYDEEIRLRRERDRERAKKRMRRVRARRKGTLVSFE